MARSYTQEQINSLKPYGSNVLIKVKNYQGTTPGGIVIPQSKVDNQKTGEGVIVSKGFGSYNQTGELISIKVKEGYTVIFNAYAGGEDFTLIDEVGNLITDKSDQPIKYKLVQENAILGILS